MNTLKVRRLTRAGFKVGSAQEFLELSDAEAALVEVKVRLTQLLKSARKASGTRQADLAAKIQSSQSRVAKMEAGSEDISLDLICRALFALGVTRDSIARTISAKKAA